MERQIVIQHFGVRSTHALDQAVESHLFGLQKVRQIDAAHVSIARRWDAAPPYLVRIHLTTPGPDVRVEGADQTARAAVLKALRALDADLRQRTVRTVRRQQSNLQSPAIHRNGVPSRR